MVSLKRDQAHQVSHLIEHIGTLSLHYHGEGIKFEYLEPALYWYSRELYDE